MSVALASGGMPGGGQAAGRGSGDLRFALACAPQTAHRTPHAQRQDVKLLIGSVPASDVLPESQTCKTVCKSNFQSHMSCQVMSGQVRSCRCRLFRSPMSGRKSRYSNLLNPSHSLLSAWEDSIPVLQNRALPCRIRRCIGRQANRPTHCDSSCYLHSVHLRH